MTLAWKWTHNGLTKDREVVMLIPRVYSVASRALGGLFIYLSQMIPSTLITT